jgi:two-component system response regulator (stage 0 sporulation protein A)
MAKILVIDDDELLLEEMKEFLEGEGYTALVASKANEALRLMSDTKPDLMIIDVIMPGIDGFALLKQAKEKLPDSKTVVLSGVGDEAFKQKAEQLGADHYVVKPMNLDSFRKLIEDLLHV